MAGRPGPNMTSPQEYLHSTGPLENHPMEARSPVWLTALAWLALLALAPGAAAADTDAGGVELAPMDLSPMDLHAVARATEVAANYTLRTSDHLQQTLEAWATAAGWQLQWNARNDVRIGAPVVYPQGTTFTGALESTLHSLWQAGHRLQAREFTNRVITIEELTHVEAAAEREAFAAARREAVEFNQLAQRGHRNRRPAPVPQEADFRPHYRVMPIAWIGEVATRHPAEIMPAGTSLSVAMAQLVRNRGWELRWNINEDYILDADFPVPGLDVVDAVTYIVHAYQVQGGLLGVAPRVNTPNRVVTIEPMTVREGLK